MISRTLRVLFLSISIIALAAACGGDGGTSDEYGEDAGAAGPGMSPEDVYVSPEDSIAAAREIEEHSESVRRRVEREAGVERDDQRPSPVPAGGSVEDRYRACVAQAEQADGAVRGRLMAACENLRRQPLPEAPPR